MDKIEFGLGNILLFWILKNEQLQLRLRLISKYDGRDFLSNHLNVSSNKSKEESNNKKRRL